MHNEENNNGKPHELLYYHGTGREGLEFIEYENNLSYFKKQEESRVYYFENKQNVFDLDVYTFTFAHTTILERFFRFVIFFFWAVLVWFVFIDKLSGNGLADYIEHLTNWAWTFHAFYFFFDIISYFDKSGSLAYYLHSQLLWILNGISWLVFWLVFFVLGDNPDLLLDISIRGGGKYDLGKVFIGDRMFHVVPAIILLVYFILRRNEIGLAVVDSMNPYRYSKTSRFINAFIVLVILPGLVVISYRLFSNIEKIYGVHTGDGILLIVGIIVIIVHTIIPYKIFYDTFLYTARPKRTIH